MEEFKKVELTKEQVNMLVDALDFKMCIFSECSKGELPYSIRSEIPKLQTLLNYLKSI